MLVDSGIIVYCDEIKLVMMSCFLEGFLINEYLCLLRILYSLIWIGYEEIVINKFIWK